MGDEVTLVSSAEETAKDVYRTLQAHNLLRTSSEPPTLRFQATGDAESFANLARRFLGPEVQKVEKIGEN
jgi:glutamate racemase